jgi:hypothetical protein
VDALVVQVVLEVCLAIGVTLYSGVASLSRTQPKQTQT